MFNERFGMALHVEGKSIPHDFFFRLRNRNLLERFWKNTGKPNVRNFHTFTDKEFESCGYFFKLLRLLPDRFFLRYGQALGTGLSVFLVRLKPGKCVNPGLQFAGSRRASVRRFRRRIRPLRQRRYFALLFRSYLFVASHLSSLSV